MRSTEDKQGVGRRQVAPPTIEFRDVTKRFGSVVALAGVSIEARAGQVTALVGENGAGKSTLSGVAAGLIEPDDGSICLDGEEVRFDGPAASHEAGIRIAPQELVLCPDLSIAENILLGVLPKRHGVVDRSLVNHLAKERMAYVGVFDLDVRRAVRGLTLVEQSFVQIARALTPGARVLIVDEPTAAMTSHEADRFIEVIRRVTDKGVATLYVSHHLDEVARLADSAVVLRDGRVAAVLGPDEISHDRLIQEMLGGRVLTVDRGHPVIGAPLLDVRGITTKLIRGATFSVHAGEIVAVYGISGSGREELGGALVGTIERDGAVHVGTHLKQVRSIRQAIDAGMGYVPPERRSMGLVLPMSVGENICLSTFKRLGRRRTLRNADIGAASQRWIESLKIATPGPKKPVEQLSGGSQQKALLARWFAHGSQVLVLEEPTRGVDIGTKAEIHRLLRATANEGSGVLMITSDIEEVVDVADRVLIIRHGRIVVELRSPRLDEVASAALVD